jgi:hypothetical protein
MSWSRPQVQDPRLEFRRTVVTATWVALVFFVTLFAVAMLYGPFAKGYIESHYCPRDVMFEGYMGSNAIALYGVTANLAFAACLSLLSVALLGPLLRRCNLDLFKSEPLRRQIPLLSICAFLSIGALIILAAQYLRYYSCSAPEGVITGDIATGTRQTTPWNAITHVQLQCTFMTNSRGNYGSWDGSVILTLPDGQTVNIFERWKPSENSIVPDRYQALARALSETAPSVIDQAGREEGCDRLDITKLIGGEEGL